MSNALWQVFYKWSVENELKYLDFLIIFGLIVTTTKNINLPPILF